MRCTLCTIDNLQCKCCYMRIAMSVYAELNFVAVNCSFLFRSCAIDMIAHTHTHMRAKTTYIRNRCVYFFIWVRFCRLSIVHMCAWCLIYSYQFYLPHFEHTMAWRRGWGGRLLPSPEVICKRFLWRFKFFTSRTSVKCLRNS